MSTVVTPVALSGTAPTRQIVPRRQAASCRVGRLVRIDKGRLKGLIGRLMDAPISGRWLVELRLFGSGLYVRIDADCLKPLEDDSGV